MPTLTEVTINPFFTLEYPSSIKFNLAVNNNIQNLIQNDTLLDNYVTSMFQDLSGGAEQATIPHFRTTAPSGWTRNVLYSADYILRVTDGSSIPVGDNPEHRGGYTGGSWSITSLSISSTGSHNHTIGHAHGLGSHTHTFPSHNHTQAHTHTIYSHTHSLAGSTDTGGTAGDYGTRPNGPYPVFPARASATAASHSHGMSHTHTTTGGDFSSGTAASAFTSSVSTSTGEETGLSGSTDVTTATDGSHLHSITHDASWRPKYLDILVCSKDAHNAQIVVTSPTNWYTRELPARSSKVNTEITNKINTLISNTIVNNDNLISIFTGNEVPVDQAQLSFALTSAPVGWTREVGYDDSMVRVTTGVGLASGGSWIITGNSIGSSGAHTHGIGNHSHSLSGHTHIINSHAHTLNGHSHSSSHAHTSNYSGAITTDGSSNYRVQNVADGTWRHPNHTHAVENHYHDVNASDYGTSANSDNSGSASPVVSSTSDASGSSTSTTSSDASHAHSIAHDGSWRPKYLNMIICSKD
jgi:hypothetical protein